MISNLEKDFLRGKLAEYFLLKDKLPQLIERIEENYSRFDAKSPQFGKETFGHGGLTSDEKLVNLTMKNDEIQREIDTLEKRIAGIEKTYHMDQFGSVENDLIELVIHKRMTYEDAGNEIGYSKIQVYRIMTHIYRMML